MTFNENEAQPASSRHHLPMSPKVVALMAFLAIVLFLRPTFVDFDRLSYQDSAHSVFVSLVGSSWILLAMNLGILLFVLLRSRFELIPIIFICNPFTLNNFGEVYNKFALMTLLFYVCYAAATPLFVKVASIVAALSLHPVGILAAIAPVLSFLKKYPLPGGVALLAVFPVLVLGFGEEIAQNILRSKFQDLVIAEEKLSLLSESYVTGNLSIPDPDIYAIEHYVRLVIAILFPPAIVGISSSSVAAFFLIVVWVLFCAVNGEKILLILSLTLFFAFLIFNPNLGAMLRNFLPFFIAFSITFQGRQISLSNFVPRRLESGHPNKGEVESS